MKNLCFPVLEKVEIKNFSLYKRKPVISVDINDGVFCLAGANGLGKSTFINIVNYALTGIVKRPDTDFSKFGSIPQFYAKNKTFAPNYFDRRIDESFREAARITIHFKINDFVFKITREFFQQDAVIELEILEKGISIITTSELTPFDLDSIYKVKLTECIGLKDFDQFVFLQMFVFTFDESHQLLFWDNSLMERVLYLFFNLDPAKAKQADQFRKEISSHESNMRNFQWDATQKQKELTNLLNQLNESTGSPVENEESLLNNYQELAAGLAEELDTIQRLEAEVKECDLLLADAYLKNSSLKNEYENLFNLSFSQEVSIENDPFIIKSLSEFQKRVCSGKNYDDVISGLKDFVWEIRCPSLNRDASAEQHERLKVIDEEIFKNNNEQLQLQKRKARLLAEYEQHRLIANKNKAGMDDIESNNQNFVFSLYQNNKDSDLSILVTNMRSQIDLLIQSKLDEGKKRDQSRNDLKILEKELNKDYLVAEETFMPMFIKYAKNFLGLDINVYLQTYSKGATLILEVNESERREKYQLSESQRYFIDIALRMALIEYSSNAALLLIDTPEGSLDIAYESRAGKMFADFTQKGYSLLLTANINSSMLLKQLAIQCKSRGMKLENMTEWTYLSEVQQNEQSVIDDAFSEIESLLI